MIQIGIRKPLCNGKKSKHTKFLPKRYCDNFAKRAFIILMASMFYCSFSHAKNLTRHIQIPSITIKGIAVNGFNQVLGSPAADLRFLGDMNFPIISAVSENGEIKPIDSETEPDALLISQIIDQVYADVFGIFDTESIPLQGRDFADLPQIINLNGNKSVLPQLNENSDWWTRSNGSQLRGYKVKQWLEAQGRLRLQCRNNKQGIYKLKLRKLVPGGLYTVWAFFFDQQENKLITDIPFGGTSANVFSADFRGNAEIKQALNFCPQGIEESERYQLIEVCVVLHPDGQTYSGVPHTVASNPFIGPGINALPHIMFPVW